MTPLAFLLAFVAPVPAPPPTGPTPTLRISEGSSATGIRLTDVLPPVVRFKEVTVVVGREVVVKEVPYVEPILRTVTREVAFADHDLTTGSGKALTPADAAARLPRGAVFLFSEHGPIEPAYANAVADEVVVISRKKAAR